MMWIKIRKLGIPSLWHSTQSQFLAEPAKRAELLTLAVENNSATFLKKINKSTLPQINQNQLSALAPATLERSECTEWFKITDHIPPQLIQQHQSARTPVSSYV